MTHPADSSETPATSMVPGLVSLAFVLCPLFSHPCDRLWHRSHAVDEVVAALAMVTQQSPGGQRIHGNGYRQRCH